uniref:DUF4477 domain-containing protein n=1 Tax=Steinernema glaseri TaxID=37863 RepID=A0A1I8A0M4_9BILA
MDLDLLQFIDAHVLQKPGRVVKSAKPVSDPQETNRLEKLRFRLSSALTALTQAGINDAQTSVNGHILSALKYKYSSPNKHMKFWVNLKKLHAQVRKLDAEGLRHTIQRLTDAVSVGSMYYLPTAEYLTHIGCLILNRIYRLDRIRVTAAKMAFVCMGYIDIGNWMTLNLLLVSVASDIAKDCLGQMIELSLIYNELAPNLREGNERLPPNVGLLRFASVKDGLIKNALSIEEPDADLMRTITYVLGVSDEDLAANYKSRLQEVSRYDRASLIKSLKISPEEEPKSGGEDEEEAEGNGVEEEDEESNEETEAKDDTPLASGGEDEEEEDNGVEEEVEESDEETETKNDTPVAVKSKKKKKKQKKLGQVLKNSIVKKKPKSKKKKKSIC